MGTYPPTPPLELTLTLTQPKPKTWPRRGQTRPQKHAVIRTRTSFLCFLSMGAIFIVWDLWLFFGSRRSYLTQVLTSGITWRLERANSLWSEIGHLWTSVVVPLLTGVESPTDQNGCDRRRGEATVAVDGLVPSGRLLSSTVYKLSKIT